MIAIYLSPIYILINIYICLWFIRWLKALHPIFNKKQYQIIIYILYFFFALTMAIGFLLPAGKYKHILTMIGNCWLGICLYEFMFFFSAMLLRYILIHTKLKVRSKKLFIINGFLCIALALSISGYGIIHAKDTVITSYDITINKGCNLDSINAVLLADLHLGYNDGTDFIQNMVNKVNSLHPDIIFIAGDIFDNDYDALDDPDALISALSSMYSKYGTYVVYGNHDIQEPILCGFTFNQNNKKQSDERMDTFINKCGFTLLRDEAICIADSFYVYGRPDKNRPGKGITTRKNVAEVMDTMDDKPVIILDHEPSDIDDFSKTDADLYLCGHTHNGQVFPLNILMKFIWENPYGYLKKNNLQSIVTSGIGVFGPDMRVGTKSEIVDIQIHFKSNPKDCFST